MFAAIGKAWDKLFDKSPEVSQPEASQASKSPKVRSQPAPVLALEEEKIEPKPLFSRPIPKKHMTLRFLLALLEKLPHDESFETRKGFFLVLAIVVKLMQTGEYPDVLVWLDEHQAKSKAKSTVQKLQRVLASPKLKPFWMKQLDAPEAVPNLLQKLSKHEGAEYINQCLFSIMKAGKFVEMAEWFLENQDTPEAKILRQKIADGLPRNKEPWYDLLHDTETIPLFDNRFPLKPYLMHGATLKGFKELHPFEMLLGEYLRLKVINIAKGTGLFGVYRALRTAESAVFDNMDTVRAKLRSAARISAERGVIDPNVASLYQSASLGEDEINREDLQASIKTQKDSYYEKYQACIRGGAPTNLALLGFNLHVELYQLRKIEHAQEAVNLDFVEDLISMAENARQFMPSSITYFYCAEVYRQLGQYCTMLTTTPRDIARRKPEVLNFNTVMLQKVVRSAANRSPQESEYMRLRDACFAQAIRYAAFSASLSSHCEAIKFNAFQNRGLCATDLFLPSKHGDDLPALLKAYQDDMGSYFHPNTLVDIIKNAERDAGSSLIKHREEEPRMAV